MSVHVTIDRIEDDMAVLEVAGQRVDWPVCALPPGASEGDRYAVAFDTIEGDPTDARARLERLEAKGPPGDIIDL